ncbi:hypothetical protein [Burkholderia thailandensis]|uniref:hypothetical protein n=1 Tax=Burkholderia thailandensis TaxID=57975 RepID=UPI000FD63EEF|nr:hypothetical protein [Burkholderia thailandensis]MCZ2895306.1 hypothetical protein [Burkholderia thailandensis]MCZ2903449.1 hypothetical protein [Burkholderia thailandensis]MDD1484278.1 hypothetical protein [Burkholderia thailandensis]MDD1490379.1 hypothetical protein [Burkholderia thailandensis]MDD1496439.1 hypothetical protein [Burkholderia thailandensis]
MSIRDLSPVFEPFIAGDALTRHARNRLDEHAPLSSRYASNALARSTMRIGETTCRAHRVVSTTSATQYQTALFDRYLFGKPNILALPIDHRRFWMSAE